MSTISGTHVAATIVFVLSVGILGFGVNEVGVGLGILVIVCEDTEPVGVVVGHEHLVEDTLVVLMGVVCDVQLRPELRFKSILSLSRNLTSPT
jgi:hypothetical protein